MTRKRLPLTAAPAGRLEVDEAGLARAERLAHKLEGTLAILSASPAFAPPLSLKGLAILDARPRAENLAQEIGAARAFHKNRADVQHIFYSRDDGVAVLNVGGADIVFCRREAGAPENVLQSGWLTLRYVFDTPDTADKGHEEKGGNATSKRRRRRPAPPPEGGGEDPTKALVYRFPTARGSTGPSGGANAPSGAKATRGDKTRELT